MVDHAWVKEFSGALLICDPNGIITEMNDEAVKSFQKNGGRELIGKNVLDCHPEPARSKLRSLMDDRQANIYTIEKKGKKKLIYQTPWYKEGEYGGFLELILEIPAHMPHFIRGD